MASTLLQPPKPLDTTGDTFHNWTIWKSEFDLFARATALNKQPKDVQAATFLITLGEDARRTYYTFKFDSEDEKTDLKILLAKFEAHYKLSENLTFNEFRFGSRDQQEGESFNDWLTELRVLASRCEFGDLEERLIRSRIILGIRDRFPTEASLGKPFVFKSSGNVPRTRTSKTTTSRN